MLHGGFLLQSNDKNFLLTHWKLFFSLISRELFLRERNWQYRRNYYNAKNKTKNKKNKKSEHTAYTAEELSAHEAQSSSNFWSLSTQQQQIFT